MKVLRDRKADIGISVNPNREPVLSYFANEEALGFELVSGAVSKHTGLRKRRSGRCMQSFVPVGVRVVTFLKSSSVRDVTSKCARL